MKKIIVVTFFIIELGTVLSADNTGLFLKLKDNVVTNAPRLTLKDVVYGELPDDVANVDLGYSPKPGLRRHLSKKFIITRIKNSGFEGELFVEGKSVIDVERKAFDVPTGLIVAKAKEFIAGKYGLLEKNIKVVPVRFNKRVFVNSPNFNIVIARSSKIGRGGDITLFFKFVTDKGETQMGIHFIVDILQPLPVALNDMKAGALLKRSDFAVENRFIKLGVGCIKDVNGIVGAVLKTGIDKGEVIFPDMLRKNITVRKGDAVKTVIRDKNMTITLKLKALEDGGKNDVIRLFNPLSGKSVNGKIISGNFVEVNFS